MHSPVFGRGSPAVQAFHTPLAVLCLGSAGGGADLVSAVPRHAPKAGGLERAIQLSVPQAVEAGAYDRQNAYLQDNERVVEAGGGGMGGDMATIGGENIWYRHHASYENEAGQTVVIEDNDYVRKVTVGDETTYTVHWTGVAYGAYRRCRPSAWVSCWSGTSGAEGNCSG